MKNLSGGKAWNEIIIYCGLEPTMIRPGNYTRKDIINSVLDFYNYSIESNIKFSSCNYRKFGRYSQTVIDKNFNNWGELLKECGLYEKLYNYKNSYETVSGNSNIIRTSKKDKNGNIVHLSIEMVTEIVKNNISDSIIDFNKLDSEYGLTRHILTKAFGGLNNFYKVFNVSVKKIKSIGENSISSILNSMNIGYVKEFHGPKNGQVCQNLVIFKCCASAVQSDTFYECAPKGLILCLCGPYVPYMVYTWPCVRVFPVGR